MPVGLPPRGGPIGRSRGRLSASSLTTYLRCPRQWLLNYQAGMSGPTRPSQIIGIILEDALCELLMMHPPEVTDFEDLTRWAEGKLNHLASAAHNEGEKAWNATLWTTQDAAWSDVQVENLENRLLGGLRLFLEEVNACFEAGGGPFLEAMRSGQDPFEVPAPARGAKPRFPLPDKVPDVEMRSWSSEEKATWRSTGEPVAWNEAWECARPWFKDPRVHQPQRLTIRMVGLRASWTWCCAGMETFES